MSKKISWQDERNVTASSVQAEEVLEENTAARLSEVGWNIQMRVNKHLMTQSWYRVTGGWHWEVGRRRELDLNAAHDIFDDVVLLKSPDVMQVKDAEHRMVG